MRKLLVIPGLLLLVSCSSPPEPAPVEWENPPAQMNTSFPHWSENDVIVTAPASGHWSHTVTGFTPSNIYPPETFYAVAHASQIVVSTSSGQQFFQAKSWLRKHGAKGVITYRQNNCLVCSGTAISLRR
ncbi:cag pathogenicity island Cag12 family protein [Enterobacter quasiroggenkampii]|uniref:cag pathogenicity island Cag12 family protein n=1 Tax=Enterobacter quasiroggenkampii TaxID=2497436 RepID=UPI0021D187C3|nr:cag pathogenicity island Cag12 family protein [Enterobacter quasiroggenkampii]MCU6278885.1 cag pathogenicity island Cag12 family protein [Enterobacter quasiroggenkampii]MCU6401198.1 cag pathogenicity island Cag12 family protein [Enterobacter quasiroggenkampii]